MPQRRSRLQTVRTHPKLPRRRSDANKGDFGKVLVLAGSRGMIGAPALVGNAALRSGAGLVILAVPQSIQQTVAGLCPCATSVPLPETESGQIDASRAPDVLSARGLMSHTGKPDVLVTGPGIDRGSPDYAELFWSLINVFRNELHVPAVIDADALNLARRDGDRPNSWNNQPHRRTVFTPHPGELARMHGVTPADIQADRWGFALRTAEQAAGDLNDEQRPAVLLKGANTIVTDGRRIYINKTGNPGMATGGSGDVLSGIIAALIGQGLTTFDAAVLAAHLHGLAGDIAAREFGQISLIATDLIDALPDAAKRLARPRR